MGLEPIIPEPARPAKVSDYEAQRARRLADILAARRMDALTLYEPLPNQEEFHASKAWQRVVRGGNRCLGAETEIYDPMLGQMRQVGNIDGEFHVYACNPVNGKLVVARASKPYVKGVADLYRVTLSNGESFTCTLEHRILTRAGWQSVEAAVSERLRECASAHLPSSSDTCLAAFRQGAGRSSHTQQDSPAGCLPAHRLRGEQPLSAADSDQETSQQQADVREHSPCGSLLDDLDDTQECSPSYQTSCHPSTPYAPGQLSVHDDAWKSHDACTPCSPLSVFDQGDQRFALASAALLRTTHASGQSANQCVSGGTELQDVPGDDSPCCKTRQAACQFLHTTNPTHTDASSLGGQPSFPDSWNGGNRHLHITALHYTRQDKFYDFEVYRYHNYVHAGGVVSHNSGKTLSCAVECARVALGRDPHKKYPNGPLLIYIIGFDQDHIGRVFHRVLFRKGLFKIIRDEKTQMWRAYRPATDSHREHDAQPSPPLIPPEMVAEEPGWANKKERVFTVVRLTNGTEIRAFSSKAEPPQGDPVDYIWIDEDIDDENWIPELQARLSDKKGRLVWSAFPQTKNDALYTLSQRAAEEAELGRDPPDVQEAVLIYSQNPFIDAEQRRLRLADFASMSVEELAARDRGEFLTDSILMYPMFHPRTHGAPQFFEGEQPSDFDAALKDGQVPADWSRFISIDPGFTTCAALLFAVPPPWKFGDYVLLYDEVYLRQCTPEKLALELANKSIGQSFRAFVIDERGSRQTSAGTGMDLKEQYSRAFRAQRVESDLTGSGFISGSDNRQARATQARSWLSVRPDGTVKFRILSGRVPNFEKEITQKYRKNQLKDKTFEDVASPKSALKCHAMAAFEYMVAYDPKWAPARKGKKHYSAVYQAHLNELKQAKDRQGKSGISLGAGRGRYTEESSYV